ncbi:MAG: aspartate aminotransferase family protein [Clostridia bacterium]|nr:aspartate aminotransferase family protein [Clostridia bacterium]
MSIENDFILANDYEKKYCFNLFNPAEVAFEHGKGVYLYDTEGNKYMDMIGGIAVNSLGHSNKALTKTIAEQSKKLIHCCNYYVIPQRADLAYRLCKLSFADKCFFCNSGAEANEAAIKLARGYFFYKGSPRRTIITAKMSFHGRTLGTINATGQEKFREPFGPACPGFDYVEFNNIDALKEKIDNNTAAVMLELIQGESGVNPATAEYVKAVRQLCTSNGILLIIDEVQTGIGRTGKMFCYEHYGIKPDIMTLAKGLGGGVPIGAMLSTNEFATGFEVGDHGTTFGGNPLCCACGITVLEEIESKNILDNVNEVSKAIVDKLNELKVKYPVIRDIRGKGLLIGIEFAELLSAKEIKHSLLEKGFLVSAIGTSVIRIAPPLIISKSEAMKFISALENVLKAKK